MSPNRREREYAKRRYSEWQQRLSAKQQARIRRRRNLLAAGGALAAVLVVVGVIWTTTGSSSSTSAGASTASPTASASASTSADPSNPCPTPTVKAPATPLKFSAAPATSTLNGSKYTWTITTTCGPIVVSLDAAKAPKAVASTVFLSDKGFWAGSPCHRLTTSGIYVLQCGDPTGTGGGGPGYSYGPVENAPSKDVYAAGTVAMARLPGNGTSMGSQFFLVWKDSTIPHDAAGGYTVLGTITSGLDIVQKIAAGGAAGTTGDGAPNRLISIVSTSVKAG